MARKRTGFNRVQLSWYRNLKAAGYNKSQIARIAGTSHSTIGRWERGDVQMAPATWRRISERETAGVDRWSGERVGRWTTITFQELNRLTESPNIRTQRAARRELDRLEAQGYTVQDLERMGLAGELGRPRIVSNIGGKRMSWLLGRGKSDDQRRAVEEQLRAQGVDPGGYAAFYDEATGYTTL